MTKPLEAKMLADDFQQLLVGWTDVSHGTLAQQLAHAIRAAVQSGLLADGTLLPSERQIASTLAVSRSTVTSAMDQLKSEGTLVAQRGSGTRVCGAYERSLGANRVAEHFVYTGGIDLAAGNPVDASYLPPMSLDVAALLAGGGGPAVQPLGLASLRSAIARRYTEQGRITEAAQVHITSGAHQAVALSVGALAGKGAAVAVEDLSYTGIFDIVDNVGARIVPVACDDVGLVPEALDQVLGRHHPAALYVQTGPHNPTGRVPTAARLSALAQVIDRYDTVVIEDCVLAELAYGGPVWPRLAFLCQRTPVVSVGSLSKLVWSGLRIGWMRATAPFVQRTMHLRLASDLGPSVPAQLIALQLFDKLDEIAAQRRMQLKATVERAILRINELLPEWRVNKPAGGMLLWVQLPVQDSYAFTLLARRHGVLVTPGNISTADSSTTAHIRICVDRRWATVDEGLQRLQLAWSELEAASGSKVGV